MEDIRFEKTELRVKNIWKALGKPREDLLYLEMLHFGKIPIFFCQKFANSAKFYQILRNFGKKQQKFQQFLTKILRLESGSQWPLG